MTEPGRAPSDREPGLDALRAGAMLLGVVLHSFLAYTGKPWLLEDPRSSPWTSSLVGLIHGFRMPLFFIVSGYFTQMLVERRGAGGMLRHRARRIGIPLALAMAAIIPLQWAAIAWASAQEPGRRAEDIWAAAANGRVDAMRSALRAGAEIDGQGPGQGLTPLGWAAASGQAPAAALLISEGADPQAPMRDGRLPIHWAAILGQAEAFRVLLQSGADPLSQDPWRRDVRTLMKLSRANTMKLARRLGIPVSFEQVEEGRAKIALRLEQGPGREAAIEERPGLVHRLMHAPLFHHLWFLWHLLLIALGFAAWSALESRIGAAKPWPAWLAWPSAWAAASLLGLGMEPAAFGPDTSIGLIPFPAVILTYAVCFGLGCWMRRRGGAAPALGWRRGAGLALGAILGGGAAAAWAAFPAIQADPRLSAPIESACAFLLSWSALGWARAWSSGESRIVRWISDSSYWLYLAHLPLVVVLQGAMIGLAWPGWTKGSAITLAASGLLWLAYGLLVRHSWLGRLLHGPRARAAEAS